jgi:AcrR family transcriptional regulator
MGPRVVDRATRRAELVSAAARVFAERGVSATSVADIVHAAGVAQGTFYLYFSSKNDVILAVVDGVAEQMLTAFSSILQTPGGAPAERLRALGRRFAALRQEQSLTDVAEFIHRPENLSLHDRFAEQFLPRLVPLLEELISDGVADGSFDVPDVTGAAWFILGGLRSIELAGTAMSDLPAALDGAILLALRVLGGGEAS